MKACLAPLSAVFAIVYLGSTRPADAQIVGKLFQADTIPWTVLVFVVGLLVGAVAIHLLRKNR